MKIKIDHKLCQTPEECGKCLQQCPTGVFFLRAQGKFKSNPEFQQSMDGITYKLEARFKQNCNSCGDCVETCPNKAIIMK